MVFYTNPMINDTKFDISNQKNHKYEYTHRLKTVC